MPLWPQGKRFALLVTFDLDIDSAEARIGADPVTRSRGRFAARRGLRKVLEVLSRLNVRSTFFVPGWVAENYPEPVHSIVSSGHELAGHGYLHERFDQLSREEEMEVFELMENALAKVAGSKPTGFRAPYWRWSSSTLELLVARGYVYDSSLMDDEIPYIISCCGREIVELPVDWRLDDWPYLEHYRALTPEELADMWIEEMRYAARHSGFIVLTMHPQCVGRGARVEVLLERVLREAYKLDGWVTTCKEVVEYVKKWRELFPRVKI